MEAQLHAFLSSALDESEWPVSGSSRFTSEERAPVTARQNGAWIRKPAWTWWRKLKKKSCQKSNVGRQASY